MSQLLSATIGRLLPRYRSVSDWAGVYQQILATRPISTKTLANRRATLRQLVDAFGSRSIGAVKPHEIAQITRQIHAEHPAKARRVLIEARDMFAEAVIYGWINTNPAAPIKHQPSPVVRRRLSLDDWRKIHAYAVADLPPWVGKMLVLALVTGQRRSDLQAMQFDGAYDGHLHVTQQKTGTKLRLPLALHLDVIGVSIAEAIASCRDYARPGDHLLRKSTGGPLVVASLSSRFEDAREGALGMHSGTGAPPSLHECRSLSERLYRRQGIDTRTLLGHKHQAMTDVYNDDRGLTSGEWKTLEL